MAIGHALLQDQNYGTNYHWTLGKHHQLPFKTKFKTNLFKDTFDCNLYLLVPHFVE